MLTIENIGNTNSANFNFGGHEWILYRVDVNNIEYQFMFIPTEDGIFKPQNVQLVLLDRNKKRIGSEVLGYRLWTTDGTHIYIETKDIPNWNELVTIVCKNKMIYANN